jgi:hypothetical protein
MHDQELLNFVEDLYDPNGTGRIDISDFAELLPEIHEQGLPDKNLIQDYVNQVNKVFEEWRLPFRAIDIVDVDESGYTWVISGID